MRLSGTEAELLLSTIEKSGGIKKWRELRRSVHELVASRNKPMIVNFARASCRTDGSAQQTVMLMLLGLALGDEHYSDLVENKHEA